MSNCYCKSIIKEIDGVPCFSVTDNYIENYQQISEDHISHFEATGHNPFMREDHWREIEASTSILISKYVEENLCILDVGVGTGRLFGSLKGKYTKYGMDISMRYLAMAKLQDIDVCMSRVEDMPYKKSYFDAVICTDVLEHVFDLNTAFSKILSVVKPGGILIVRVPYREDLSGYLDSSYPYEYVHMRNFDEFSLKLLIEKILEKKVIEYSFSGYRCGAFKPLFSGRLISKYVAKVVEYSKIFGDNFYYKLCKKIRKPTEINVVIQC